LAERPGQVPEGAPLTLDLVVKHWQSVHAELKRARHVSVGAMLQRGQPAAIEGDTITVSFPPGYTFHQTKVAHEFRPEIEAAASRVFGRPVTIEAVLADADTSPPAPQQSNPSAADATSPLPAAANRPKASAVEQVKEVFPGSRIAGGRPAGS
jgi:hypothetical protein